jgi:hypothetical protein
LNERLQEQEEHKLHDSTYKILENANRSTVTESIRAIARGKDEGKRVV